MNNKYSFEMSLDTKGYTDGTKAAEDANADFVSSLGKVNKDLPNLRKELGASRREVASLALAYQRLSNTEKNSPFGKQLKKQLDECKKRTADLVDLSGDLNQEIKNMASDTATWDAMKEGLGVGKDAMTALVSLTADLTGNEKELGKMIQKIAQVQSLANTAISVGNALQKQSAMMNGIRRVQELALSKAIQLETSSTVGATAAQKAFNLVAKANPYVLLGTAALALVSALTAYMVATNKATDSTVELKKEIHDTSLQAQKDAQSEITKLDLLYKASQNQALSIDERRKATQKMQELYPSVFGSLKEEEILVGKAAVAYEKVKEAILAAAMARAYENKINKVAEENVDLEDKKKELEKQLKLEQDYANRAAKINTGPGAGGAVLGNVIKSSTTENELENINKKIKENNDLIEGCRNEIEKTTPKTKILSDENKNLAGSIDDLTNKLTNLKKRYSGGFIDKKTYNTQRKELEKQIKKLQEGTDLATKSGGKKEVKAVSESIGDLEKKISTLQEKAKKGILPNDLKDPDKYKAKLKELQDNLKELKIKWGFEEPDTKLQKLQKAIEAAQKMYILGVEINDLNIQQTALAAFYTVQDELNKHEAAIKIKPLLKPEEVKKQLDEINNLIKDTYKANIDFKFDFSSLPEAAKKEAESALEQFNKIKDARQKLNEIIENKDNKYGQEAIDLAREKVVLLTGSYNELFEKLKGFSETNTMFANIQQSANNTVDTLNSLGQVTSSLGGVFKSVGNDAAAGAMEIISATTNMVSQVVPQIMKLVGVKQAEAMAEGTVQGSKLPWPANLGAIASIVGTILSVFAQIKTAGKYAHGGTIGGSSYYGDKLIAFVNSGETILTREQTKNAVNAIDNNKLDKQIVIVGETKLKGSDIYIALKNYDGVQSKLGKNIGIR